MPGVPTVNGSRISGARSLRSSTSIPCPVTSVDIPVRPETPVSGEDVGYQGEPDADRKGDRHAPNIHGHHQQNVGDVERCASEQGVADRTRLGLTQVGEKRAANGRTDGWIHSI